MYLLLDECCGRSLVRLAESLGHTAQLTVQVAALGRQASDPAIFAFARSAGAIFVTVNRNDFVSIAARSADHPGIIILPSVPGERMRMLFRLVLVEAEPLIARSPNMIVEVSADGRITSHPMPP